MHTHPSKSVRRHMRTWGMTSYLFWIVAVLLVTVTSARAATYYVSTDGSDEGDGSIGDPWDLTTALAADDTVDPGDTIYIRAGTYGSGGGTTFTCELDGTEANRITVRAYPHERATIDGHIEAIYNQSSWVIFRDLEVTNSDTDREQDPEDRESGFTLSGVGSSVINCIIHNTGHPAIGFWQQCGDGAKLYGNIIWGTGIYDPGFGIRGSAVYTQNLTGTRYLTDNIVFRNFTCGLKPYTAGGHADGFRMEGNTVFENPYADILVSANTYPSERNKILNNCFWASSYTTGGCPIDVGTYSTEEDIEISGNYIAYGQRPYCRFQNVADITFTNNTCTSARYLVSYLQHPTVENEDWDYNTYHATASKPFARSGIGTYTFSGWKTATGFDTNSTFSSTMPTNVVTIVRPNAYEEGRGHVTVYNWPGNSTVSVDVSSILDEGDEYEVLDAQNYFGPKVASGVYGGGNITIPMNQTEVAPIIGDTPAAAYQTHWNTLQATNVATAPYFGVFVIRLREAPLVYDAEDAILYKHNTGNDGEWVEISDEDAYSAGAIQADEYVGTTNTNGRACWAVTFSSAGIYEFYYRARTEDMDEDCSLADQDTFGISRGDMEPYIFAGGSYGLQTNVVDHEDYEWHKASDTAPASYAQYIVEPNEIGAPQTCYMATYDSGVAIDAIVLSKDAYLTSDELDEIAEAYLE